MKRRNRGETRGQRIDIEEEEEKGAKDRALRDSTAETERKETAAGLSERKKRIKRTTQGGKEEESRRKRIPECQTDSKALEKSREERTVLRADLLWWNPSAIIPILKHGKSPSSYRPISITSP